MREHRIKQVMNEAVKTPECTHEDPPAAVCPRCCPLLWNPPKEWSDETQMDIYNRQVEMLLEWKRQYYVEGESEASDARYDSYENSLRKVYPDHPVLQMVGYSAEGVEECLAFIKKVGARYP